MRTLLLLSGAVLLLTGCGRKSPPVAEAAPKSPAVAERQPVVVSRPQPDTPGPASRERPKPVDENTVADFGGPKDIAPPVEVPQPRPQPKGPAPKPPVAEEEEEPRPPKKPTPVKEPSKPVEPLKPQPMPPGGNRIEAQPQQPMPVPTAPRRAVAAQDMKDIHLFVDTASQASGKMPDAVLIQAALGAAGSPAAKLVATGDIVLTGARQRESCWAFQKDAATLGGWIVTNNGAEQVDAATAKRLLGGR